MVRGVCRRNSSRFFLQSQEGDKAEAYLRKGALSIMPDHGDGLADLAVAMAMQGEGDADKMTEALAMMEKAEKSGASGNSFDKRRYVAFRFGSQPFWRRSASSGGGGGGSDVVLAGSSEIRSVREAGGLRLCTENCRR